MAEGHIGQIYHLHQERLKLGRVRSKENVIWSLGVHDIAVLLYLAGSAPKEVECSGHSGIAGGQYSDLSFEKKKISLKKTINMQINKTGKLFSFCCMAPLLVKKKKRYLKRFESIGLNIGLLFQISDDLIDLKSTSKKSGKKTKKDLKKGKATLINLLGYENTIKYAERLKMEIFKNLSIFEKKSNDLKKTINFITERSK